MDLDDIAPPPEFETQVGLLTAMLADGTREWRQELGEPPQAALRWQPFANGHSIGAVLLHMASVEAGWIHGVIGGEERTAEQKRLWMTEATRVDDVQWPQPPDEPLSWYFGQLAAVRSHTLELLRAERDPERVITRGGGSFTVRWILHHVVTHEAYHGGQAVLLSLQWLAQYGRR